MCTCRACSSHEAEVLHSEEGCNFYRALFYIVFVGTIFCSNFYDIFVAIMLYKVKEYMQYTYNIYIYIRIYIYTYMSFIVAHIYIYTHTHLYIYTMYSCFLIFDFLHFFSLCSAKKLQQTKPVSFEELRRPPKSWYGWPVSSWAYGGQGDQS